MQAGLRPQTVKNFRLVKPFAPDELVARVRALLRRTEAGSGNGRAHLTGRELEVLRLLADGLEYREIAERLVISPKTVATHIEHVLGKLGVHSVRRRSRRRTATA